MEEVENPDPYFEPVIQLPQVETKTLEEDEKELIKLRAKLYRYDSSSDPPEWKERGTGDVKILNHIENKTYRILMRRDKTLKICANHYVLPHMELKPNCGSEKAWVWSTLSDFADEEEKSELLAIRFSTPENAQKFKAAFDNAKKEAAKNEKEDSSDNDEENSSKTKESEKEDEDKPNKEIKDSQNKSSEEEVGKCSEDKLSSLKDKLSSELESLHIKDKDTKSLTENDETH